MFRPHIEVDGNIDSLPSINVYGTEFEIDGRVAFYKSGNVRLIGTGITT